MSLSKERGQKNNKNTQGKEQQGNMLVENELNNSMRMSINRSRIPCLVIWVGMGDDLSV